MFLYWWLSEETGEVIDLSIKYHLVPRHKRVGFVNIGKMNAIMRTFPDGTVNLKVMPCPYLLGTEKDECSSSGVHSLDEQASWKRISCYKSKQLIFDLAKSNYWDYFVTLTYSPQKVDRYDYEQVYRKTRSFFRYLQRIGGCSWLLVPELHKDGAIHVHGLVSGPIPLLDSGHKDRAHRTVYNAVGYHLGFTMFTRVSDQSRVSSYMTKYVTKEMLSAVPPGRRRFWSSRGLMKPKMEKLYVPGQNVEQILENMRFTKIVNDVFGNQIIVCEGENVKGLISSLSENILEIDYDEEDKL